MRAAGEPAEEVEMGLFDKKKKDDFDSPVEEISLSKPSATSSQPAKPQTAAAAPAGKTEPAPKAEPAKAAAEPAKAAAPAAKPAPAPQPEPEIDNYGINRAIELMRALPKDNTELVVKVVKTTLESIHIKVASIIKDAARKESDIEGRIGVLNKEIAELEGEIATRKKEIGNLEADHAETRDVKERLMLAEKMSAEKAEKKDK